MKKLLLGLIFTATLSTSFAGDKGNGGVGISCPQTMENEALRGYMFFDYYEAITKYKVTVVPPSGNTVYEKVEDLISRIADHDPERAEKYLTWLESFESEAARLGRTTLPESKDMSLARFDSRCKLTQAILQGEPLLPGDARYTINSDFFNKLDLNQQAYGVMHEIIFREAREIGHENSRFVRYFLSQIMGDLVNDMSVYEYTKLLDNYLNQVKFGHNVFSVYKDGIKFLNNKQIKWSVNGDIVSYSGKFVIKDLGELWEGSLFFDEDGVVKITSLNKLSYNIETFEGNLRLVFYFAEYNPNLGLFTILKGDYSFLFANYGALEYLTDSLSIVVNTKEKVSFSNFLENNNFELRRYKNNAIPNLIHGFSWHNTQIDKVYSWHSKFIPETIKIKNNDQENRIASGHIHVFDKINGYVLNFDKKGNLISQSLRFKEQFFSIRDNRFYTTGTIFYKKILSQNEKKYKYQYDYVVSAEDKTFDKVRLLIDSRWQEVSCSISKGQKIYVDGDYGVVDTKKTCLK